MLLQQGQLLVHEGTHLEVVGDLEWTIADAQVINEGTIHLLEGARLNESAGHPITGTGTEHAWLETPAQGEFEPGGLGLVFISDETVAPFQVVRGHVPISMAGSGAVSVARWFQLIDPPPGPLQQLRFRADMLELNGHTPEDLDIFDANSVLGPWSPMVAEPGPGPVELAAVGVVPRPLITAFDKDAAVGIPRPNMDDLKVWPTLVQEWIHIRADNTRIHDLQLFDGNGRMVPIKFSHRDAHSATIDAGGPAAGPLFLRVNGAQTFKLIKE